MVVHTLADAAQAPDPARPAHQWLPAPEAIADGCIAACQAGEPGGLVEALEATAAPALDFTVTPLSARAGLLGARPGGGFYHHELNRRVPVPAHLAPEVEVWRGGSVPAWHDGVLEEPKYFSFFLDAPFAAYNPNYRRKWRPHELLHGAVGFFWHPEMTRFEAYVGARLDEILPVVHWYGFDEMFRPRCADHDDAVLYRDFCEACERRARPYWEHDADWLAERRDAAIQAAQRGLEHFEEELAACMAEIERGERVEVARPRLDSSSDAVGYLHGHWNRMTAWSFGIWAETFLTDDHDYASSLHDFAGRVAATASELVAGQLAVDPARAATRRRRRTLQDMAYRIYVALEWLEEGSEDLRQAEATLMPRLDQAAHCVHRMLDDEPGDEAGGEAEAVLFELIDGFDAVRERFPGEVAERVPAAGYSWTRRDYFVEQGLEQVADGLLDAVPQAWVALDEEATAVARRFIDSDDFWRRGRIARRFADFVQDASGVDERAQWLARFEAWASVLPRRDEEAELFAALPNSLEELGLRPGRLRLNTTLRRERFPGAVAARMTGDPSLARSGEDAVELARIIVRGELRLVEVDADTAHILDAVEADVARPDWLGESDPETLATLLEHAFLVWLPKPA